MAGNSNPGPLGHKPSTLLINSTSALKDIMDAGDRAEAS